ILHTRNHRLTSIGTIIFKYHSTCTIKRVPSLKGDRTAQFFYRFLTQLNIQVQISFLRITHLRDMGSTGTWGQFPCPTYSKGHGVWVMGSGSWGLGHGFWVMGSASLSH